MRRIALVALLGATLLVAVTPALAGKGGPGGSSTTSSSIAIASINGGTFAATKLAAPKLGDSMTFATTVGSMAGWAYPMVAVTCYQDVNGDGVTDTSITGPDIVYSELQKPDATFTLGGYSSIWTLRGGGPAVCRADLDSYGWKAGVEYTQVLANTGFDTTG